MDAPVSERPAVHTRRMKPGCPTACCRAMRVPPKVDAEVDVALPAALRRSRRATPSVSNTLQTYLREIRRAPLFTPEEEFDTRKRARAPATSRRARR